jgi:hypothetical protein
VGKVATSERFLGERTVGLGQGLPGLAEGLSGLGRLGVRVLGEGDWPVEESKSICIEETHVD